MDFGVDGGRALGDEYECEEDGGPVLTSVLMVGRRGPLPAEVGEAI